MADAFSFKKGARAPDRIVALAGNGVTDLSTLDSGSIKFVYRAAGVVERNEITAAIEGDATDLRIRIPFGAVDVDEIGKYQWHIEAAVGGKLMYWPEKGFYTFSVTENIEEAT
jgi:hypothetical protein